MPGACLGRRSECLWAVAGLGCRAGDFWAPPLPFAVDNIAFDQGEAGVSARMEDKAIHPAEEAANFNGGHTAPQ